MPTLIEQLQAEAINREVPVSQLLRRVKLVAVKLKLGDTADWVDHELNGYPGEVPDYRNVRGHPSALNPYRGWIPILMDPESMNLISYMPVRQAVSTLEALLPGEGRLLLHYAPEVVAMINSTSNLACPQMALQVDRSVISGMLDRVRTQVLDWAIELERAGIHGEGVNFTSEEQQRASGVAISIGTFHGNLNSGDLTGQGARVNLGSVDRSTNTLSSGPQLFAEIEEALSSVNDGALRADLVALVHEMRDSKGKRGFSAAYQKFIATAADYMTLLSPFIPPLTALLAGG